MNVQFAVRRAELGIDAIPVSPEPAGGIAPAASPGGCPGFGPLEWLVIAIGQRDGAASFQSRPLLDAIAKLFDRGQPNGLANQKLEELRRLSAFASEHGWHVPPCEMAAFLRAGWSDAQMEVLIDAVSPPADRHLMSRIAALRA